MAEKTEIRCDACDKDLTYTGNCEDYYLVVGSASKSPWYAKEGQRGGVVTSMAISPPVNKTHHFCGLTCMDKWRDAERLRGARWKLWYEDNKKPAGVIIGGKECFSISGGPGPTAEELAAQYPNAKVVIG